MIDDPMNRKDNPYLTEVGRLGLTITIAIYAITWSLIAVLGVVAYALWSLL